MYSSRWLAGALAALALLTLALSACAEEGGLFGLPTMDVAPAEEPSLAGDRLMVHLNGESLPCDRTTGTWYIPVDRDIDSARLETDPAWQTWLDASGAEDPYGDGGVGIYITDGERWETAKAVLTRLPVLCIDTEDGELPGDSDTSGALTLYDIDAQGHTVVTHTPIEIRLRGNTSRRFPKRSYRLKIVDGHGEKCDLSVAGLRSDDDWILNPMYSDTSKIREALGFWLWEEINSSGRAANSSRFAYAEVLLNGEYWGLYGIQERIDRKQVGADRDTGILYKVGANDRPSAQKLLSCDDPEVCDGFEVAFAGAGVERPWAPAVDYVALLEGADVPGSSRLDRRNAVDYCLWAVLVQARDNHFKNQFIHCVYRDGGYALYRIPWDLNHTLGDLWCGSSPETNFVEYDFTRLALDDITEQLIRTGDEALAGELAERWRTLRKGTINEENLIGRARELFSGLYPAILRDSVRWPQCGMGEGSAANIRDIEDYVRMILPRMDGWIESLQGSMMEMETMEHGDDLDR